MNKRTKLKLEESLNQVLAPPRKKNLNNSSETHPPKLTGTRYEILDAILESYRDNSEERDLPSQLELLKKELSNAQKRVDEITGKIKEIEQKIKESS